METRKQKYRKILLTLLLLSAAGNLAGCIPKFCDWYTDHIYCLIEGGISRLTAPVPVAVGELLMYLGVLLVLLAVLFLILLLFLRKKPGYRRFCRGYYKTFLMTLICVVFVYTFFWVIPFRGTVLGQGDPGKRTSFTFEEIRALTVYAANGVNAAAEEIEITADGKVDFEGSYDPVAFAAGDRGSLLLGPDGALAHPAAATTLGACGAWFRLNGLQALLS